MYRGEYGNRMETTETVKDAGTKLIPETGAEMGAKTDA